ncbi:lipid-A-disaccharide synthase [Glaciecola sp. MH2013]|uniref:lipid-A-disaccharide synthase n=1 Tax=Glaciecola sp. MH2013 TaxID=2785524 RepID=UPI0018A00C2A|nr:lipid-A-disaccharide synthase [Glaciecola sp. MH2013]MBF7072281.1 lipid-A-disaccharide synthase [Glaciecola sp. MH2013]
MVDKKGPRIAIVAGEASGDILAAGFMKQLQAIYPDAEFEGIGGKHLTGLGLQSLFDMEELSVMGLVEVLKHLPRLLHIRKSVIQHFTKNPPDIYIGVDAPDFNLAVESKLKLQGVQTIHYVSPTVWAWREKRIHKIAKATNLVLGIFPFEADIYQTYSVPYQYVGHTMADSIPLHPDKSAMRDKFGCHAEAKVLAILPGSRAREVDTLLPDFFSTAQILTEDTELKALELLIPAANSAREHQIHAMLTNFGLKKIATDDRADKNAVYTLYRSEQDGIDKGLASIQVKVSSEAARDVMIAADSVLLASGTASLEAMLCKTPMVVAYKMSKLTHMIMKRLYKPDYFSLPNILANKALVPELLQEEANPKAMANLLKSLLLGDNSQLIVEFTDLHRSLQIDADRQAANAIASLLDKQQEKS